MSWLGVGGQMPLAPLLQPAPVPPWWVLAAAWIMLGWAVSMRARRSGAVVDRVGSWVVWTLAVCAVVVTLTVG